MNIINYNKVVLLFSKEKQPQGILKGFNSFCNQYNVNHEVVISIKDRTLEKGEVYLVLDDKNLISNFKRFYLNL